MHEIGREQSAYILFDLWFSHSSRVFESISASVCIIRNASHSITNIYFFYRRFFFLHSLGYVYAITTAANRRFRFDLELLLYASTSLLLARMNFQCVCAYISFANFSHRTDWPDGFSSFHPEMIPSNISFLLFHNLIVVRLFI